MLFERIFRKFQEVDLRYAVIGGIAVNLHGYNRLTGDLDIIISLSSENLSKFIRSAKQLGLAPRLPVKIEDFAIESVRLSWIKEKNLKVFTVYNPDSPLEHVDVKIDDPGRIEQFIDRAISLEAGDMRIVVVSVDDLIVLKKEAGRDRDMVDVRALERIKELNERRRV